MKSFAAAAILGLVMANEEKYIQFMAEHNRSFGTREEFEFRMNLFMQREAEIMAENANPENTFTLAHNKFSDRTEAEFMKVLSYRSQKHGYYMTYIAPLAPTNATTVNWVTAGAVTAVKNQGSCGSCWTFSSTGAMESAFHIDTGAKLVNLAEQQLVDCDRATGNNGCNGGDMYNAFQYAHEYGMMKMADYRYTARDGKCAYDESKVVMKVVESARVPHNDSTSLKAALADRPVSVAIEADRTVFQSYSSGVLNSTKCGTDLDHGVLAVGFGTENGQEYFLVKNSWGSSWGENGYIKIAVQDGEGICGIQMDPSYPTKTSKW